MARVPPWSARTARPGEAGGRPHVASAGPGGSGLAPVPAPLPGAGAGGAAAGLGRLLAPPLLPAPSVTVTVTLSPAGLRLQRRVAGRCPGCHGNQARLWAGGRAGLGCCARGRGPTPRCHARGGDARRGGLGAGEAGAPRARGAASPGAQVPTWTRGRCASGDARGGGGGAGGGLPLPAASRVCGSWGPRGVRWPPTTLRLP